MHLPYRHDGHRRALMNDAYCARFASRFPSHLTRLNSSRLTVQPVAAESVNGGSTGCKVFPAVALPALVGSDSKLSYHLSSRVTTE